MTKRYTADEFKKVIGLLEVDSDAADGAANTYTRDELVEAAKELGATDEQLTRALARLDDPTACPRSPARTPQHPLGPDPIPFGWSSPAPSELAHAEHSTLTNFHHAGIFVSTIVTSLVAPAAFVGTGLAFRLSQAVSFIAPYLLVRLLFGRARKLTWRDYSSAALGSVLGLLASTGAAVLPPP
jgi:hypothetical protein